MVDKNPNHKEEDPFKMKEFKETRAHNVKLAEQDINEDFLSLKSELLYFKNKDNLDSIPQNIEPTSEFLMLHEEFAADDVVETGLDLCFLVDRSESLHPYRIFLKKSMYFALKDMETFIFSSTSVSPETFDKIRVAFVSYGDRDTDNVVETFDFVDYKSLGDICKKIDEIDIKEPSIKKRAVFDGMDAMTKLKWDEAATKIIIHYCGDPQYGSVYTYSPKGMPDNYDPYPEGVKDIKESDLVDSINELNPFYNFVKFNDRVNKFQEVLRSNLGVFHVNAANVKEVK